MKLTEEIGTALRNYDMDRLDEIAADLDVNLTPIDAIRICDQAGQQSFAAEDVSWGGWIIWFKSRIQSRIQWGSNQFTDIRHRTATLHVWFIWIEETEEMLANLKGTDVKRIDPSPTRSRITDYQSELRPVNKTAWHVSPDEMKWTQGGEPCRN